MKIVNMYFTSTDLQYGFGLDDSVGVVVVAGEVVVVVAGEVVVVAEVLYVLFANDTNETVRHARVWVSPSSAVIAATQGGVIKFSLMPAVLIV